MILSKFANTLTGRQWAARAFSGSSSITPAMFNIPGTKVTTLPNGLRVASQPMFSEGLTVGLWIDAGSRYETAATNGTAHFLEHLAFKGTKRRDRVTLEKEIENMGGHLNAYTSREQTVYFANVHKGGLKQGVDILADVVQNSTLSPRAIEEERGVILREMEEVEKSMEEVLLDRLHSTSFRDSTLGYTILGPEENILSIKREHIVNYINENYTADRMVLVAAGPVEHAELVKYATEQFGQLKRSSSPRIVQDKPYFLGSEFVYRNDEMGPTAHIAVGFEGVPWRSPDCITFMLMQQILGGFDKSDRLIPPRLSGNRTVNNIAHRGEGFGCADSYKAFNTCYKDTGLFGWYATCDEIAVEHCVGEMMWGVTSMAYTVTEEEVQRAKRQLKTALFASLDDPTGVAEDIGRQLLVYNRRVSPAEFVERLDKIDSDEVKRVAWNKLHDAELSLTAIGPTHGLLTVYDVRRMTNWYRY